MSSPRPFRQAVVILLYTSRIIDAEIPENLPDESTDFWDILQEKDLIAHQKTIAKALVHATQNRASVITRLEKESSSRLLPLKISEEVTQLLTAEKTFSKTLTQIKSPKNASLAELLPTLYSENNHLTLLRTKLLSLLDTLPQSSSTLHSILTKFQTLSERIKMFEAPLDFPEVDDLRHLRQLQTKITETKTQALKAVTNVRQLRKEIDLLLTKVLDNYSLNRLNPIDYAILSLGIYELKTPLSPAIVINEAVEIAKLYGSSESASFVNGVLDKCRELIANTTQPVS